MRSKSTSTAVLILILVALFLTPLYSVYAVESRNTATKSANPRLEKVLTIQEKQKERIDQAKLRFADQITKMRDKIASREAQFKLRIEKFQDKVKGQIALKINQALNRINQNQTQQMDKHLDKMAEILDKVETRTGNTATDSAQVAAARSALETSHTAVEVQAGKDYTISISTESAVRKDAQAMREKLHTDLRTTRVTVTAAKQAVMTAIRSLLGVKEGTKSATQSGLPVGE